MDFIVSKVMADEARALQARLASVKSFALHETMVPAAAISTAAQAAIERHLVAAKRELADDIAGYLRWLEGREGQAADPEVLQRRFTFLRLRFNAVLSQLDIFAQALTQRSQHEIGVWLGGLDAAATDALALPGYYDPPPVICYLDRGMGAAIRRARTRLPGGGLNPVAVVRVPRERMVGVGIGASLIHEVGHQAAALLDLVRSLRAALQPMLGEGPRREAWSAWDRWISEIVADFWAVAKLGIGATLGLMSVVSLPTAFVFRPNRDDPHPTPWIRVKLSCAMGRELYPHPQWERVERLWDKLYPTASLDPEQRRTLAALEETLPQFAAFLVDHRPASLKGHSLREVMPCEERRPARLAMLHRSFREAPLCARRATPTLALAVLGQARANQRITPEEDARMVAHLLEHWALCAAIDSNDCAPSPWARSG